MANCYLSLYTGLNSCTAAIYDYYPDCYGYYTDGSCCTSFVSWEYQWLDCFSSAYGPGCFDYSYYSELLTDYPCYSDVPSPSGPNSVTATTTPVPSLSLIEVSYAVVTTTSTHSPVPTYSQGGNLLHGYCATPDYVLLDDPTTAFWAPVVGCATDKTDCCPYSVAQTTPGATVTVDVTTTAVATSALLGLPSYSGLQGYPIPANNAQATLANCPNDYTFVSGGCCPSGYKLWNVPLGGQVPCYSSLTDFKDPPPIPITANQAAAPSITAAATTPASSTTSSTDEKPTSAVLNVVFAVKFPAQPPSSGLSTGAKAGIGVGAGAASIAIIALSFFLFRSIRKNRRLRNTPLPGNNQNPPMVQNQNDASNIPPSSMIPVPADTQTQFQTPASGQTPGGYFPPQQQQVLPQVQQYYAPASQPGQYSPQQYQSSVQGQSLDSYTSPPLSTASPPPPSEGGYSYQASYGSQVPLGQVSSYSGSQDPRVSYPGGVTMQQGSQSWGQAYQQSTSQQAPQELGQESQQSHQMAYGAPAGATQYLGSSGNPPELQGYQVVTHMSVPTQQQTQTLEQHSSQEQEQTQTFVEHRLVTSSDMDSVSTPLQQSSQPQTTSPVIPRPVPGTESGE